MQSNWGKDWRPGTASGLPSLAASRHLYECVLRKFVLGINNLCVEIGALVDGLVYDAQQERVTGMPSQCWHAACHSYTISTGMHASCCSSACIVYF